MWSENAQTLEGCCKPGEVCNGLRCRDGTDLNVHMIASSSTQDYGSVRWLEPVSNFAAASLHSARE